MSDDAIDLALMNELFNGFVPHNRALGLVITTASFEPPAVTIRLPWSDRLVGHPETGVLHGGAITTLLDACCGASVYFKLKAPTPIATLDLRVDFLGKVASRRDVFARAECHQATRTVAFARATAWADGEATPFATATASFAIGTKGKAVTDEARARLEGNSP
jgi:uncharacterized protein (TIGR00369 family)